MVRIKVGSGTHSLRLSSASDAHTLIEVLRTKNYDCSLVHDPKTILDLGSNIGITVLYFRALFPNAHIIAVEANPDLIPVLRKNTSHISNLHIVPCAVSDTNKEAVFHIASRGKSSSLDDRGAKILRDVTVETRTVQDIIRSEGVQNVDLIKFDIEGAEYRVFKAFTERLKVQHYMGEIHLESAGCTVATFLDLFPGYTSQITGIASSSKKIISLHSL